MTSNYWIYNILISSTFSSEFNTARIVLFKFLINYYFWVKSILKFYHLRVYLFTSLTLHFATHNWRIFHAHYMFQIEIHILSTMNWLTIKCDLQNFYFDFCSTSLINLEMSILLHCFFDILKITSYFQILFLSSSLSIFFDLFFFQILTLFHFWIN